MVNILNYTNYRTFLIDFYEERKKSQSSFSYQIFAEKAGFTDKSSVYSIMKGKRSVSTTGIYKLSKALDLNRSETEYLENLVAFNQAKTKNEKKFFFERLFKIRTRGKKSSSSVKPQTFQKDQYQFYSKWYHVMIHSIIEMYEFRGDYKWLASMTSPRITTKMARQSIALLEKLQLVQMQPDGLYVVKNKNLATGKEVLSLAVANFHQECMGLASRALDEIPPDKRNISGLTMGISESTYSLILSELQEFQKRILELANADQESDRVYHFNFHLFPTSRHDNQKKQ